MASEKAMSTELFVQEIVINEDFRIFLKTLVTEAIDDKLETLTRRVEVLEGDVHDLHQNNEILRKSNVNMANQITNLTCRLELHCQQIDDLQQNAYTNSLQVTGIPEEGNKENPENTAEVIKTLAREKLNVELGDMDIDRIHRSGKPTRGKPRPIVVKFTKHSTRHTFLKARTNLKGTKIGVQEVLSPNNQFLLERARQLVKDARWVKGAWSWDGRVFVMVKIDGQNDGKKVTIRSKEDLNKIYWDNVNQHRLKDFDTN